MKKSIFLMLAVVFISFNALAQQINWVSLEEAVELQKKTPKKIMMDVYTNWCGPCKMLDKNTFQNKDVADYINKNYYAVKFNAEGNDEIKVTVAYTAFTLKGLFYVFVMKQFENWRMYYYLSAYSNKTSWFTYNK